MSTHKHIDLICVAVLLLTLLLTVLFINGERLGIRVIVDEDAEANSDSAYFTANDLKDDWDTSGATKIVMKGDSASVSGGGAYFYDGDVIISGAGSYLISGELNDGSIIVDAKSSSKVRLLFDGVRIFCSDDACLRIDEADKVFLTLAEGSENILEDGDAYCQAAQDDGRDGVIFAHDDLTINGSGSLTVTANYRHGISANDDLVITGGGITVTAPADGVRANDSLRIRAAVLSAETGDDAIVVNHEEGYLYIESGSFELVSSDDAIHTAGDLLIAGGSFEITAADDAMHSDKSVVISEGSIHVADCYEGIEAVTIEINGGDISVHCADDGLNANGNSGSFGYFGPGARQLTEEENEETWIHINGGVVCVNNESASDADGFDSNGDIVITGGSVRISLVNSGSNSALDCGSESGGSCTITGGDIIACGGYSMAESFDGSSAQCSILYNFRAGFEAGTTVSLEDSEGNVLISHTVPNSFSSVVLSSPEMQVGKSYLIIIGDQAEEVTLNEVSASYGDAASSGFGGMMNWGGMQRRDDFPGFGMSGGGEMPQPPGRPERDEETGGGFGGTGKRPGGPKPGSEGSPPPDFNGTGSPPDFSGTQEGTNPSQAPQDGLMNIGEPKQEMTPQPQETATETEETTTTVSGETWFLVALSFAALAAGLYLAIRYKPE